MYAENLKCLPNKAAIPQKQLISMWTPFCRKILRKTQGVSAKTPEMCDEFSVLGKEEEVEARLPLFMKETLPEEGTVIVQSPEKAEAKWGKKKEDEIVPVSLAYVFGHSSVIDTKICYGSS